jgi:hypothetical protein
MRYHMAGRERLAKPLGACAMRGRFIQSYMTIGAIFGVILAGPLWYVALFSKPIPSSAARILSLLIDLLLATVMGVLRAFAWAPSLIYHVIMLKIPFMHWLMTGWW